MGSEIDKLIDGVSKIVKADCAILAEALAAKEGKLARTRSLGEM